jgi:predicted enzyme related to lactoylglutathione lyase
MSSHHRIDYFELPADDLAATKRFYSKAFGWIFAIMDPAILASAIPAPSAKPEAFPATRAHPYSPGDTLQRQLGVK